MNDLHHEQRNALAHACAEAMYARDQASQSLGMRIEQVGPGYARLSMTVRQDMLNGHESCHGGFLFALADSAFAFACNSHNQNTVAAGCNIEYLSPARHGDLIHAEAVERFLRNRTGVYDVSLRNQNGELIALFRGKSHRVNGEVLTP